MVFEGTINVLSFRTKVMVFQMWAHERTPLNSQWLVLKNGGTNFHHCNVGLLILCSKNVLGL